MQIKRSHAFYAKLRYPLIDLMSYVFLCHENLYLSSKHKPQYNNI